MAASSRECTVLVLLLTAVAEVMAQQNSEGGHSQQRRSHSDGHVPLSYEYRLHNT